MVVFIFVVSCLVFITTITWLSYKLGDTKTMNAKLSSFIGFLLAFIPPLAIFYIGFLAFRNDVPDNESIARDLALLEAYMQANSQIACDDCDLLIDVPKMADNHSLICPGCHNKIFTKYKHPLDYCISFALSATILLLMANSFPFLSFEAQGQFRTITLIQASQEMFTQGYFILATLVYSFIFLLPLLYLFSLLALLIPIRMNQKPFKPVIIGRLMGYFIPWIMVEVFIVGVLIALVKVIELANIIIGFSFWAYVGFVIFFTLSANLANRHQLWTWIENAKR